MTGLWAGRRGIFSDWTMGWTTEDLGFDSGKGKMCFLFSKMSRTTVLDIFEPPPDLKQPRHEAASPSTEFKNVYS